MASGVKLISHTACDASDWDRVGLHLGLAAALLALGLGVAGRVGDAHHDRVGREHG